MPEKIQNVSQNILKSISEEEMDKYTNNEHINLFIKSALHPKQEIYQVAGNTNAHLITLFSIALSLRAKRILELGVWRGTSTQPLLYAAKLTNGLLESVDISRKRGRKAFDPEKNQELREHWKFYKKDAIQFLQDLPDDLIYDLIFIDDDHAYQHVKEELLLIANHVNKRSIILLHDLMNNSDPEYSKWLEDRPPEEQGGPTRAVKELPKEDWEFATVPVCNGLTMLRKISD